MSKKILPTFFGAAHEKVRDNKYDENEKNSNKSQVNRMEVGLVVIG